MVFYGIIYGMFTVKLREIYERFTREPPTPFSYVLLDILQETGLYPLWGFYVDIYVDIYSDFYSDFYIETDSEKRLFFYIVPKVQNMSSPPGWSGLRDKRKDYSRKIVILKKWLYL